MGIGKAPVNNATADLWFPAFEGLAHACPCLALHGQPHVGDRNFTSINYGPSQVSTTSTLPGFPLQGHAMSRIDIACRPCDHLLLLGGCLCGWCFLPRVNTALVAEQVNVVNLQTLETRDLGCNVVLARRDMSQKNMNHTRCTTSCGSAMMMQACTERILPRSGSHV